MVEHSYIIIYNIYIFFSSYLSAHGVSMSKYLGSHPYIFAMFFFDVGKTDRFGSMFRIYLPRENRNFFNHDESFGSIMYLFDDSSFNP